MIKSFYLIDYDCVVIYGSLLFLRTGLKHIRAIRVEKGIHDISGEESSYLYESFGPIARHVILDRHKDFVIDLCSILYLHYR